jgi:protein O-GlcNAc transferase
MAEADAAFAECLRLFRAGDFAGSEQAALRAVNSNPRLADAWYVLGRACQQLAKFEEAVAAHRQALQLQPGLAEAHNNLGIALKNLGRVDEALGCYREAVRLRPDYVDARNNLGNALAQLGHDDEAIELFRTVIAARPEYAEAHNNLGIIFKGQGRWAEAESSLRAAIRLRPQLAAAHANLGIVPAERGDLDQALRSYDQALELDPHLEEAICGRGCVVGRQGDLVAAEAIFRAAATAARRSAGIWANHGYFLGELGRIAEALTSYQEAIRQQPGRAINRSNYLYYLNYDPGVDGATLLKAHCREVAGLTDSAPPPSFFGHDRSKGRPLRVGYVSPDFRRHAVASFMEPILANHDRGRVQAFGYADVGSPDAVTDRLRALTHSWRPIRFLSDEHVIELVRRDRIDILVDLAGHTARNRLAVFARRPAPVQITYLGYPSTTGLATFDALLTDAVVDPPGAASQSTEEPLRLPGGSYCYAPPLDAPEVPPLPMLRAGFPTFGSLHKLPKLNSQVLDLWSALLRAIPTAHLVLLRDSLKRQTREELFAQFEARDIAGGRVEIRHDWRPEDHWAIAASFDVALDVFPWCGHTTACESLWMGVPIVTLAGERRSSRMTASVLTTMGLDELIAATPEQYIEAAARLVSDPARLAQLRGSLRERMRTSRLCDGALFTRGLEDAYDTLWHRWCSMPVNHLT